MDNMLKETFFTFLQAEFDLEDRIIEHSMRVSSLASTFANKEGMGHKIKLITTAGLLHELTEPSLCGEDRLLHRFMLRNGYNDPEIDIIFNWIVNAKSRGLAICSLGTSVIWDANLLDEIGAVGLAARFLQTYTSGVSFDSVIDDILTRVTFIEDNVITQTGKSCFLDRSNFVAEYIERFHMEKLGKA